MVSDTKKNLRLGFAAIVGLMILLTSAGLMLHATSIKRIESIVNTHNAKTELIIGMRIAARERTLSLQKMLIMSDPFERDEEWLRFNGHGTTFIHTRSKFQLLNLSKEERDLLDEQGKLVRVIGPMQQDIAEQILEGKTEKPHHLLLNEAIPFQIKTFSILSKMLEVQKTATKNAVAAANADYKNARNIMLFVTLGIILLSIAIARYFIAQTSKSEQHLFDEKERAHVTLHSIGDAVITTDAQGKIEKINTAAENLLGINTEKAKNKTLHDILDLHNESDIEKRLDLISDVIAKKAICSSDDDCIFTRFDNKKYAVEYTAAPINSNDNEIHGAIIILRNVTEMRSLSRQLIFQAHHDPLTGLANRPHFEAQLKKIISTVRKHQSDEYWLCYLDIDQFKVINDTCGHLAGDELLKQIADTLRNQLRDSDLLARMGGDEFTILLKCCDTKESRTIVERLRNALQQMRFSWEDKSFSITGSIGVVQITHDNGGLYDLMRAADTSCYIAKDQGRNRTHFYQHTDDTTVQREGEMQWVHRVNKAIETDGFVLYFQKIQGLLEQSDELHGEILLRMLDSNNKLIPPGAFIPSAERYNLMSNIDRWVIKNTFQHFDICRSQIDNRSCLFSINLSAQSICEDDLLNFVIEQFDKYAIAPNTICFEITETAAISNLSRAIKFINALKERGCYFSLDDFGSGLSSFAYLKTLPTDFLKIDGTFVRDIESDPMDHALVSSINQMGHVMGIRTIAEYVENEHIAKLIRSMGIDYGQGYGIAKPVPLTDILPLEADVVELLNNPRF